jgi:hypothetical protein
VIAVRNRDDKAQLLEAGRLWQRLHLEATLQGVAMHPLNQMMEMADHDCFEGHIGRADEGGNLYGENEGACFSRSERY